MRILAIRSSAMGDVALTLPPVISFIRRFPEHKLTLLTSAQFGKLFDSKDAPEVFLADFRGKYSGMPGLLKLFIDLKVSVNPDIVLDLHGVLRSKVLTTLFTLSGIKVYSIDKGRKEKKQLLKGKVNSALKHSTERYMDVFREAGFDFPVEGERWLTTEAALPPEFAETIIKEKKKIGVAPYARHALKMWPEEKMIKLLQDLAEEYDSTIFLFGGGKEEIRKINTLKLSVPNSIIVAGKLDLQQEIALIGKLDLMIAMDSSNMHLGALAGVPTVSIWGATHPMAGFKAYNQPDDYSVQISKDELECRPCTIYGKGECRRKDFACMNTLSTAMVMKVVRKVLG